ncbi:hypothetical protein PN437_16565, partial [Microcystis aeruginosa CS-564/01]|nr:hypothetical protein [Microcystis aeruginosa CS-564/01]
MQSRSQNEQFSHLAIAMRSATEVGGGEKGEGRTNRVCGKKFVGGVSSQESVLMKKFSPPQMKEVSFPTPHTPHPTP